MMEKLLTLSINAGFGLVFILLLPWLFLWVLGEFIYERAKGKA